MKAIVLSGGGARGAYQIGAWRAFRKLGLDFDIVTGTSVGAFNGALMVQNDFKKAYKIWYNMNYDFVFTDKVNLDDRKHFAKTYIKNLIKYGGFNVDALEKNVSKNLDFKKFKRSKIDFGIVAFNLSTKKELKLCKKDIDEKTFADYLMASATCYPAFRKKNIDGLTFIDGGYVNNIPVDLAVELGAKDILVLDIGFGIVKREPQFEGISIKTIRPRNKMSNLLGFDKKYSRRLINLGYNDIMKEYNYLDGNKYTFSKGTILKMYNKYNKKQERILKKILGEGLTYKNIKSLSYDEFLNVIEYGAYLFKLKDSKRYIPLNFNYLLKKSLKKTEIKDISSIILDNKRLIKSHVVRHIYNLYKEKKYDEIKRLSIIFKKEFIIAMYLHIV